MSSCLNKSLIEKKQTEVSLNSSTIKIKSEKKILKVFILHMMRKFLFESYHIPFNHLEKNINSSMECYLMDNQAIQFIIREIVESGEYTLEGIAYHTKIPFDIILDACFGNNKDLSITSWSKIIALYFQVKPEIAKMLVEYLNEFSKKHSFNIALILNTL